MSTQPKINLIYVASIGRSGTTLLESMLGAHPAIETTGELHLWPHEILQGGVRPCGSGLYVHECPFWTEMRNRVDPLEQPPPRLHFFREQHNAGKTLRLERLREFGAYSLSGETRRQVMQYGSNNASIFRTFADLVEETTGDCPAWIVDASKDPYRLLWLQRSGLFNIKVIHMVRHPCGFAYSVTKDWIHRNGIVSNLERLYYTTRQSGAWVIQNTLIRQIIDNHMTNGDHVLVRYEDLATHPQNTFRKVCRLIGVNCEEQAVDNWRSGSQFTIAGNPMRYEDRDIELDERWKRRLPVSSSLIAKLISSATRSSYDY